MKRIDEAIVIIYSNSFCLDDGDPTTTCVGEGSSAGTTEVSPESYFFDPTNPPLNTWDFSTVWGILVGVSPACLLQEASCLAIPPPDTDGDGVPDFEDECPGTPAGATVDAVGCFCDVGGDSDGDGVNNCLDVCPDTPVGEEVDATGCPQACLEVFNAAGVSLGAVPNNLVQDACADPSLLIGIDAGDTLADNLELLPGESAVNGGTITGNVEGGNLFFNVGIVNGNVEGVDTYYMGDGAQTGIATMNGNVENVNTVIVGGESLITGNTVDTGTVIVLSEGDLLTDGNVHVTTALEVHSGGVLHIGGNLICDAGVTTDIDPTATLIVDGNSEGGCSGLP